MLVGIGPLGIALHQDVPVEYPGRLIVQDAFEEFAAGAIRHGMLHEYPVVDMLLPVHQVQAVNVGICAAAIQLYLGVIPDQPAVQGQGKGIQPAAGFLVESG